MKPPSPFAGSYRDVSTHRAMLQDVVRTTAYDDALKQVIGPTSRVLDFGTGSGVLAIFAARHGAARIDALERSVFVRYAERIAKDSGYPEIRFHHADEMTFSMDGKVDVLVSEWMGHFVFFEAMMEPLLLLRDRWLEADGIMIPARVKLHAALLTDESIHDDLAFLQGNPYGIDFSSIAEEPLRRSYPVQIDEWQVDACRFDLGTLDMKTVTMPPHCLTATGRVRQRTATYGVVAWFSAELTETTRFGTGPSDPPTHWDQMLFPFPRPFLAIPERDLVLEISPPRQSEDEDPTWAWTLTDGVEQVSVNEEATFADIDGAHPALRRQHP